jgi:hypothetical protein
MTPLPYGIHADIPEARYHADELLAVPTLSSSLARVIVNQSPRHAWTAHPRLNPDHEPDNRKTFDIGRAAHRAVLGRGGDYVAIPDELLASNGAASTKAAKDWIEDARAQGLTPLKAEEVDRIGTMAEAVRARLAEMRITFDAARSEVVALAEVDGVACRAMIDSAPADPRLPLYDFKTTTDASPEAVQRAVMNYGYDVQAAFYLAAWEAATGERRKMRFVFVEKEAPHEVAVVELRDDPSSEGDWMATARSKATEARRIWAECLAAGEWPGYPPFVALLDAPGFHNARWSDREIGQPVIRTKPSAEALRRGHMAQAPERMTA